jgi:hypothetical protein
MKNRMQESAGLVVRVRLSPSMAAWPGSVIEDDLVRKSEGQRMQATVPARHGMAAASQPATPTWRRLYRLVPRGLAPIHPAGQVTLSQEGSRLPTTCRHPIRPGSNYSIFYKFVPFGLFFFQIKQR